MKSIFKKATPFDKEKLNSKMSIISLEIRMASIIPEPKKKEEKYINRNFLHGQNTESRKK